VSLIMVGRRTHIPHVGDILTVSIPLCEGLAATNSNGHAYLLFDLEWAQVMSWTNFSWRCRQKAAQRTIRVSKKKYCEQI
jgi:hypothetical protein